MAEEFSLSLAGSRKRLVTDKIAKYGVTTGAILVLTALLLIFVYLLYVVQPIFESAHIEKQTTIIIIMIEHIRAYIFIDSSLSYEPTLPVLSYRITDPDYPLVAHRVSWLV